MGSGQDVYCSVTNVENHEATTSSLLSHWNPEVGQAGTRLHFQLSIHYGMNLQPANGSKEVSSAAKRFFWKGIPGFAFLAFLFLLPLFLSAIIGAALGVGFGIMPPDPPPDDFTFAGEFSGVLKQACSIGAVVGLVADALCILAVLDKKAFWVGICVLLSLGGWYFLPEALGDPPRTRYIGPEGLVYVFAPMIPFLIGIGAFLVGNLLYVDIFLSRGRKGGCVLLAIAASLLWLRFGTDRLCSWDFIGFRRGPASLAKAFLTYYVPIVATIHLLLATGLVAMGNRLTNWIKGPKKPAKS